MNELIKTNTMKEVVITNPTTKNKNLSKKSPKLMTNPLKVGDINFTVAVSLPKFMTNNEYMILFLNMANCVTKFMKQDDDYSSLRLFEDYGKVCMENGFDMIKSTSILVDCAKDLHKTDRQWCDLLVTPQTNLKYECLPIFCKVIEFLEQIIKRITQINK